MANPWADLVISLGRPRRWYRLHSATPGTETDQGFRATSFGDARNLVSVVGSGYTARAAGPLLADATSYSVAFTDAYLSRGLWDSVDDFGTLSVFGCFHIWFKSVSGAAAQFIWGTHPTTGGGQQWAVYMLAGKLAYDVTVGGTNNRRWTSAATYNDGNWHLLGIECVNGSTPIKFWVDGVDITGTCVITTSGGSPPSTSAFLQTLTTPSGWTWALGKDHRLLNPFIGNLAEAMTWDRTPWTAAEQLALYRYAAAPPAGRLRSTRRRRALTPII